MASEPGWPGGCLRALISRSAPPSESCGCRVNPTRAVPTHCVLIGGPTPTRATGAELTKGSVEGVSRLLFTHMMMSLGAPVSFELVGGQGGSSLDGYEVAVEHHDSTVGEQVTV